MDITHHRMGLIFVTTITNITTFVNIFISRDEITLTDMRRDPNYTIFYVCWFWAVITGTNFKLVWTFLIFFFFSRLDTLSHPGGFKFQNPPQHEETEREAESRPQVSPTVTGDDLRGNIDLTFPG